jgi:hypothetical protein
MRRVRRDASNLRNPQHLQGFDHSFGYSDFRVETLSCEDTSMLSFEIPNYRVRLGRCLDRPEQKPRSVTSAKADDRMPAEHCRSMDIGTPCADRHVGVRAAVANPRRFDWPMNLLPRAEFGGHLPILPRETHPFSRACRTSLIPARRAMPRLAISVADAQASGASKARLPMVEEYPAQSSSTDPCETGSRRQRLHEHRSCPISQVPVEGAVLAAQLAKAFLPARSCCSDVCAPSTSRDRKPRAFRARAPVMRRRPCRASQAHV